jgi:hypothetical protein
MPTEDLRRYLIENNIGTWTLDTARLGPTARERLQAALERDFQGHLGQVPRIGLA